MSGQKMISVLQKDVIDGFSESFCRALFKKLVQLNRTDKIFEDGWKRAEERETKEGTVSFFTDIASTVIEYLCSQLKCRCGSRPSQVVRLISRTEEFLAIFEKKF